VAVYLLWAVFLKITEEAKIIGLLFSTVQDVYQFSQNMGLGYILGNFFTNSSGHPYIKPLKQQFLSMIQFCSWYDIAFNNKYYKTRNRYLKRTGKNYN
jgi:hypothetical protein